jgi:hypothetical protein
MNLDSIVTELKNERDRISRAIDSLLEGAEKGVRPTKAKPKKHAATSGPGGYWKNMSPEQRSVEMTRRARVRAKNQRKSK